MRYTEYAPHPLLEPLVENFYTDNIVMTCEKVYLVGTMTHWKQPEMGGGIRLFGIRLRPAAFAAFYDYTSLRAMTDCTVDFEKKLAPEAGKLRRGGINYLNRFFLEKLSVPKHTLFPVIEEI